jgi:DNA-binding transcriptional MerR regulator
MPSMNVTALARACKLSRSTILYYESLGLLKPVRSGSGQYRIYGGKDLLRLRRICLFRGAGLSLAGILKHRLTELSTEIETLRDHQRAIARLLKDTNQFRRFPMVTKQKWVEIMRAAGFTEADMQRWHAQFETSAPEEHQEFLEFLHIPTEEIHSIREWSRRGHK